MLEELNLNYEFVVLDPQKGETQTPEYLNLTPRIKNHPQA
ncbi:MAG: hypothetical protein IPK04_00030 [Bdellovibrionales bacterium]|nr:hypothetical protein [Bdellovibrionales bacterium]